ncbi:Tropomyosin protein [Dioscorea alata]|uniref:Tropomyosin protein n=1 Tax=Dioscorea alata TaxID=55571 RepID=A0ACB7WNI3_DIOAL|nr:Tropomyosin protein [Dioscorea alata]
MASKEEEGGSLFEGMVLFTPSDLSSPSEIPPSVASAAPPPPAPPLPISQPLDEDLFSNLTLLSAPPSSDDPPLVMPSPSRQISRKKKRAVRVGYARDDEGSALPFSPPPRPLDSDHSEHRRDEDISCAVLPENKVADKNEVGDIHLVDERLSVTEVSPPREKDEVVSVEEKLDLIKAQVSNKLDRLREMAALLAAQRKQLGRRRRKAAESVNSVSQKYKELEKELEEACEAEDFERAERVSESLAATEKEKDALLTAFKEAEADCDAADLKMQELLDSQIAAEEEGVELLEQLGKDAAYTAEFVFKRAEEISAERIREWQYLMEILESKKLEADIEFHVINDARLGLESSIEHLVEDDRLEKERLQRKQEVLTKELDELLAMVRMKEAEIADNNSKIQEIERNISSVVSKFYGTQSNVDKKYDDLHSSMLKLEVEQESLFIKKKEIDDSVSTAEEKQSKLNKLAIDSANEAKICQNLVDLRKRFASSIMKSREEKIRLAKTEEKILEDIQMLRQQNSSARTSLQVNFFPELG